MSSRITGRCVGASGNENRRRQFPSGILTLILGLTAGSLTQEVRADNFANAYYEPRKDQLVVTMFYRGTNPDHTFSLQWGPCKDGADGSPREIEASVLDSQWQDAAEHEFRRTTRFSLAGLACRPVTLTLRTAPRFYYTLQIPTKPRSTPG
jgi:hypothetical protein